MVFVDIGSGYNPRPGFKTCDDNFNCDFYSVREIPENSVDVFNCRNVVHHVEDVFNFSQNMFNKMKENSAIVITDCRRENYNTNFFLDVLWYRYVFQRPNIFICSQYRDYSYFFKLFFNCVFHGEDHEKEIKIFTKGNNMDAIKEKLEKAGYDFAVAIATQAEINAGAACGQLSLIESL